MSSSDPSFRLDLTRRGRRLRRSPGIRSMVRETRLSPENFIYPLFVCEGAGVRREVTSMPGVFNLSVDEAVRESVAANADGVPGVLLFGIPADKDEVGSAAYDAEASVQAAVRAIKRGRPGHRSWSPTCACASTPSTATAASSWTATSRTTRRVELLVKTAVSHAEAGADIVAPSDMMDGRVGAIRRALDERGLRPRGDHVVRGQVRSAFYGPFREAADSAPQFGDRRTHQMDPANARGGAARGGAGHRGRRGHRHGEARAGLPRRHRAA